MNAHAIIEEAKTWCFGWDFEPIESVTIALDRESGGLWYPPFRGRPAWISIGARNGLDLLYHEVFHSVAFNAPFCKRTQGWWTEGFCNAFSESVRRCEYPFSPARDMDVTKRHHREYLGACSALMKRWGRRGPEKLRALWKWANVSNAGLDDFNNHVGYDPRTGLFYEPR